MAYIQNVIKELGPVMQLVYLLGLVLVFMLQYTLFIYSKVRIKKFSLGLSVYMLLHAGVLFFLKASYGELWTFQSALILLVILSFNYPMFVIIAILREIIYFIRKARFRRGLKSAYNKSSAKALTSLAKVLPFYCRKEALEQSEMEQLKHIYKDSKNDASIALDIRIKYCKALIAVGIPNISVPHTYDVNMDILASQDDVLKVAHGALNEAKLIVTLAPNACVFSCRKYGENLVKYLFAYHNLQGEAGEDLESFSTLLFLMKKHKVIEDQEVLRHFYHIKESGNHAAHGHLCDAKTAADLVEDALYVDQWFRRAYHLSE